MRGFSWILGLMRDGIRVPDEKYQKVSGKDKPDQGEDLVGQRTPLDTLLPRAWAQSSPIHGVDWWVGNGLITGQAGREVIRDGQQGRSPVRLTGR